MLALELRSLAPRLPDLRGKRFVDAACGTGRWLAEALTRGAQAAGADLSAAMLAKAKTKPGLSASLAQADLLHLPFRGGCADVVVCAFSLAYLPGFVDGICELARLVRAGGMLIISDIHPEGLRRGWTRSFRDRGQLYEIAHEPYTIDALHAAAVAARLELHELLEPRFGEPEREIFKRAGKPHLFQQAQDVPAVLIARWIRR